VGAAAAARLTAAVVACARGAARVRSAVMHRPATIAALRAPHAIDSGRLISIAT